MSRTLVSQSWNLDRIVITICGDKLVFKARNRGKDIKLEIPDPGWADKLGPPSTTSTEGTM